MDYAPAPPCPLASTGYEPNTWPNGHDWTHPRVRFDFFYDFLWRGEIKKKKKIGFSVVFKEGGGIPVLVGHWGGGPQ